MATPIQLPLLTRLQIRRLWGDVCFWQNNFIFEKCLESAQRGALASGVIQHSFKRVYMTWPLGNLCMLRVNPHAWLRTVPSILCNSTEVSVWLINSSPTEITAHQMVWWRPRRVLAWGRGADQRSPRSGNAAAQKPEADERDLVQISKGVF